MICILFIDSDQRHVIIVNAINKLTCTSCHCERSPAPHGVQGEVKQSHRIATPACRNLILQRMAVFKHSGVQARRFAPRNDHFIKAFTIEDPSFQNFTRTGDGCQKLWDGDWGQRGK
jgi:hypothetical protein